MALFSIITVSFNEEKNIMKTLESVYNQTCCDFEYLLIDGLSTDKTYNIIKGYEEKFSQKGISYKTISEQDTGIYNAMNKGIMRATGKWLIFMNAGDYFCSKEVLKAVKEYDCDDTEILYGDYVDEIYGLYKYIPSQELDCLKERMAFSHQSAFIRREVLLERPYDERYRIAADYNFFLSNYMEGKRFKHMEFPVAVFAEGGASSSGNLLVLEENLDIQRQQGCLSQEEYNIKLKNLQKNRKKDNIKKISKKIIPKQIQKERIKLIYRKKGYKDIFWEGTDSFV